MNKLQILNAVRKNLAIRLCIHTEFVPLAHVSKWITFYSKSNSNRNTITLFQEDPNINSRVRNYIDITLMRYL